MARKRRRLHKRYGNRRSEGSAPRSNPPVTTELVEYIVPGFGGYGATRLLTRLATVQIARRKPSWAKHAGVLAALAGFGVSWWGAHKVKWLEKWATPLTVGAGIAALQTILQLYIPKIGWLIGDADTAVQLASGQQQQQQMMQQSGSLPELTPVDENPDWYTYDDKYDSGRQQPDAPPQAQQSTAPASQKPDEDDILADLNLDDAGMGAGGIFSN